MCGRIASPDLTWAQLYKMQRDFLDAPKLIRDPGAIDLAPSWNVKPTQPVDILYARENSLFSTTARWWFVPHWHRGTQSEWKQTTFNARIETASEKPTFRTAWAQHRCIIPVLGYYEWTGEKGKKQPHWITTKRNTPVLYFAGLYSNRLDGHSCTILTRPALAQIEHIHHRSPVILSNDELLPWMNGEIMTTAAQNSLGAGWDGQVKFHEVSRFGRDDDGLELIERDSFDL